MGARRRYRVHRRRRRDVRAISPRNRVARPPRRAQQPPRVEQLERRWLLASIVITKGGTYTGSWENLANRDPVVTVKTTEPVVIENATIKGKGHLIFSTTAGANITVRKTTGV